MANVVNPKRIGHPGTWFDSAPGHQEIPKPPSGGFGICGSLEILVC
jgi:hypothetical protein